MVIKIVATIVAMLCIVIFGCFLICDKDGYFDAKKIIVNYSNIFSKSKLKVRTIYAVLLILSVSIGIVETINSDLIESVTLIVSVLSGVFLAFLPVVMDLKNKDIKSIKEDVYKNTCKETNSVLIFELLISIIELFFCFVYMFLYPKINLDDKTYTVVLITFSSVIYYLMVIILLNILFILKRIRTLISFQGKHT